MLDVQTSRVERGELSKIAHDYDIQLLYVLTSLADTAHTKPLAANLSVRGMWTDDPTRTKDPIAY